MDMTLLFCFGVGVFCFLHLEVGLNSCEEGVIYRSGLDNRLEEKSQ